MTHSTTRNKMIERLARFPGELAALVAPLSEEQLNAKVSHDPWTIAQIVHHCADSHMNSFIRLKLVLTENTPPLKGYDQDAWVLMTDENGTPVESSLSILRGLHVRWVKLFQSLQADDWSRRGMHSETGPLSVDDLLRIYNQHCDEHLEQIEQILAVTNSA